MSAGPPRRGRARAAAEEGRQRADVPHRWPGRAPGERQGRRLLPAARPRAEMAAVRPQLVRALDDALETVTMAAGLDCADFEQDYEYVALRSRRAGLPARSRAPSSPAAGHTFPPRDFGEWVTEQHVAHSNALHASLRGAGRVRRRPARQVLAQPRPAAAGRPAGGGRCRARARPAATRSARSWSVRSSSWWPARRRCGSSTRGRRAACPRSRSRRSRDVGYGATEAPRGVLFHRYQLAADGTVLDAQIVPPTSQNLASIEARPARVRPDPAPSATTRS